MSGNCHVVMYHYVRNVQETPFPEIKALSVADFERQLDWLQERYRMMPYEDFEKALENQNGFSEHYALLTFDDGFVDHYQNVFPILKKRGISGIFFVAGSTLEPEPQLLNVHKTHFLLALLGAENFKDEVVAWLRNQQHHVSPEILEREGIYRYDETHDLDVKRLLNYELDYEIVDALLEDLFKKHLGNSREFAESLYLKPSMIEEMADDGMIFGYHTENHRVLSRLDRDAQVKELERGRSLLCALTGRESIAFCYPYGHTHTYNKDTKQLLRSLGYSMAFNTVRKPADFNAAQRYDIPRLDAKDLPPFKEDHHA